ncbi:tetratricopeptide repeat protein [Candidatus Acetothermia bacterium]|nr:tetratricopeptide repeat protein [Candidatus Acetothermia bacterium]
MTEIEQPKTQEEQSQLVEQALQQAEIFRKKKEYKEGIELLVDVLQYNVEKAKIYFRLGNIYFDGEDLSRAEYAYKRALEVDPNYVNAMHNLSLVYKKQKKMSQYIKTYKQAQKLSIRHPQNTTLSDDQKKAARRLARNIFLFGVAIIGVIILIVYLVLR